VRVREFAIRQALGARPADVIRVLTRDALVVVACGICAGLALLPLTTRTVRSLVVDMGSLDVELVAAVACVLALGAFASAYWPARRVGRIDLARLLTSDQ
jgi:putative ABC transport system permease protein